MTAPPAPLRACRAAPPPSGRSPVPPGPGAQPQLVGRGTHLLRSALQDRRRQFRGDHREVAVPGDMGVPRCREGQRAARTALADHQGGDGDPGLRHRREGLGDGGARTRPFRLRVVRRARGVDQGEHGDTEPVGQPDHPRRRAVTGRAGRGAALGDVRDRPAVAPPETAEQPRVRTPAAVAAEREPVVEVGVQIRLGARPGGRAGLPDRVPAALREAGGRQGVRHGGGERRGAGGVERPQPVRHRLRELPGRHDRVDLPRGQLALGGVRVGVRGRGPYPGAGEPDLGARQRQDHIGARPQRGPAAARRRVAQDRELRRARRPQPRRGAGHPLELGQGDHALLHPAAARRDQRDERQCPGPGGLVRGLQPVPGAPPQRTAQEPELEGDQHTAPAADGGEAVDDGLLLAGTGGGAGPGVRVPGPGQGPVPVAAGRGALPGHRQLLEVVGECRDRRSRRQPVRHGATAS